MSYILIFILLIISELAYFKIADYFKIIDKPNPRSSHKKITLRGGGIIFYFGALIFNIWFGFAYPWFLIGLTLIAAVSLADDIRTVSSRLRLPVHFIAMILMFTEWGLFSGSPWWYILLALIVCTGIINAYNFMDGINGLTGGYSLIVLMVLAWINTQITPFVDTEFIYVVIISIVIFNFFNFRIKARCFAGDVGAVSIAFIIVFMLGRLILQTGNLTYIILLAVYGIDSVMTIVHRLFLHENIFESHRKHAYQIMANELHIPHIVVSAIYMLLQAVIIIGFFFIPQTLQWIYFGGSLFVLGIVYLGFKNKYFYLHLQKSL